MHGYWVVEKRLALSLSLPQEHKKGYFSLPQEHKKGILSLAQEHKTSLLFRLLTLLRALPGTPPL